MIRVRKTKQQRRTERDQAMLRYTKQRQRNLLAKPGVHRFILVLDHMKAGFNVAKIFRSAEAFGAHEIQLVNIGPFDPAPGKGAFKKVPARFFDSFDQSYRDLSERGYRIVRLEGGGKQLLTDFIMPKRTAFVLGHEEWGHSFERNDYPEITSVAIPQFGEVESLNVSVAASIVMYEYVRQQGSGASGSIHDEWPAHD
ncbi:MAG: TrmH family RNA methyltransferase [gamma proteobacterium symbiont of Ctena orbiculata]|nr:TrmH family RNA methyltransferase [Candidatus Thiodiazotropha taylori]MBT3060406.1 TrmH family RNA methyltransferase [Candidatus Thiodiazotropha sp. (ex Lucina pensylvanica)]MBV2096549.1 TrmH family RNA methyltransferase [Candidatus Thiodiazotropha sp. (ex Codakia orbicularis)]PUB74183.1 MAG: TrmH family RNA methyltransferase [gamma proteobacterium symbiont of Ctena orbiculata]MBT3064209.1 TrmH family RNA methyltransferase [Candidatus Thiodiazotropha sp. (ex Lucina pensylvanica)]